jgi:hypothetical protein
MGDTARFRAFADFVADRWPDREMRIADVAGGKGYLNAELFRRGYRNVITYDKRKDRWTIRKHYRYELFTANSERGFELVLGMHPDEATDQIIAYAARRRVPFAIVPCCARPSAYPYDWSRPWRNHLIRLARAEGFEVERSILPITGAAVVLVGDPA